MPLVQNSLKESETQKVEDQSVATESLSSYEDENDSVFMQCDSIFDNRHEDSYINKIKEKRTVIKSDDKFYNDFERAC